MSYVIKAENLSKSYTIGHQKHDRYQTFSETLMHTARGLYQSIRHPFSPNRELIELEEFWALKNVSFNIKQGDRVGIIGHNGAGKSTLLKILSRVTEPTAGLVSISGRVASLLEVGTGFHPELTGQENIFLNGAILGMTKKDIKRNFDEIVAFAEIEKFLDTPVKRYSSGMYVRLAFAVAAHLEPEILVIDEVLAVGDANFQKKCLGKIGKIGSDGRTVIFVSHNMGFIQQLTNQILVINNGEKIFQGDTGEGVNLYLKQNTVKTMTKISTDDQDFFINKIKLADKLMEKGFNKPLFLEIELLLNRDFNQISFGMGIYNTLGVRIITSKLVIEKLEKGCRELIIEIKDHHLPPGNYYMSLGIGRGGNIYHSDNIISFDLSDKDVTEPLLLPYLSSQRDKIGAFIKAVYEIKS